MADIPLSSLAGPKPTAFSTMPMATVLNTKLSLRNVSTISASNSPTFYDAIANDTSSGLQSSAILIPTSSTAEQVLVNISGNGVLTSVKTHNTTSGGDSTHTIRVEIDGAPAIVYTATTPVNNCFVVGNLSPWAPSATYTGVSSAADTGFGGLSYTMMPAVQSVMTSLNGLRFSTSLRVTIQLSVGTAGSSSNKAVALYTTYIPKGL